MPYKNSEDYLKWVELHPDKKKEYNKKSNALESVRESKRKYKEASKFSKRCPSCRKHIHFRKDRIKPIISCEYCGAKIRIGNTLGANPNHNNTHGIRLKVVV